MTPALKGPQNQVAVTIEKEAMVREAFPRGWRKTARGVLIQKPGQLPREYSKVNGYRVISLLSCLGKVVEKVVAELITDHCESRQTLHKGQMGSRKNRSAVDAVACLIQRFKGMGIEYAVWDHPHRCEGSFPSCQPDLASSMYAGNGNRWRANSLGTNVLPIRQEGTVSH
jgi:Reverse transcriptase (RNA-dependent DNA polymerase)